jgi:hypothetical protein
MWWFLVGWSISRIQCLQLFTQPPQLPFENLDLFPLRCDDIIQLANGLLMMGHTHFKIINTGISRSHFVTQSASFAIHGATIILHTCSSHLPPLLS